MPWRRGRGGSAGGGSGAGAAVVGGWAGSGSSYDVSTIMFNLIVVECPMIFSEHTHFFLKKSRSSLPLNARVLYIILRQG